MHLLLSLLLILPASFALAQVEAEISGNLEAQGRHATNNEEAKEDLQQNWDQENFYLFYGNLNGKIEFKGSRLESNVFGRFSQSELYHSPTGEPYLAPSIFTFPNTLVVRDVFKLSHRRQSQNSLSEAVINKLYYEWDYEEHRFMMGRMYINYGVGEIFNPINPFNQPTGLTTIAQVAQGNDGFNVTFFVNDKYTIDFYLLGDKRINDYDGKIDRTLWVHGEYQATDNLQLDYVVGEDQRRQKVGGQVRYNFEEAMIFLQGLYRSAFVDKEPSHNLLDLMLGYDQQVTNKWHIRMESGYQKKNRYALSGLSAAIETSERFLPTEYFVALSNIYEIHPLVKVSATAINDIKSGFTYFIGRSTVSLSSNTEAELFGYVPISKGDEAENFAQKLVTTDIGVALRTFF
jgi:hypothetical protein